MKVRKLLEKLTGNKYPEKVMTQELEDNFINYLQLCQDSMQPTGHVVTSESRLKEDLYYEDMESLCWILDEIENTMNVRIPPEEAVKFVTVQDILNYLNAYGNE